MGAMPWEELAPWSEDPGEALRALQGRYVSEKYDLANLLREALNSSREEIAAWEADGDQFDLLAGLREKRDWLELTLKSPIPGNPWQQVLLVRRLYSDSGQGVGNILDVEGVSGERQFLHARKLSGDELILIFGTSRPSTDAAPQALMKMADSIGRGESVCFPVYDADHVPVGWWFAGYTID